LGTSILNRIKGSILLSASKSLEGSCAILHSIALYAVETVWGSGQYRHHSVAPGSISEEEVARKAVCAFSLSFAASFGLLCLLKFLRKQTVF